MLFSSFVFYFVHSNVNSGLVSFFSFFQRKCKYRTSLLNMQKALYVLFRAQCNIILMIPFNAKVNQVYSCALQYNQVHPKIHPIICYFCLFSLLGKEKIIVIFDHFFFRSKELGFVTIVWVISLIEHTLKGIDTFH